MGERKMKASTSSVSSYHRANGVEGGDKMEGQGSLASLRCSWMFDIIINKYATGLSLALLLPGGKHAYEVSQVEGCVIDPRCSQYSQTLLVVNGEKHHNNKTLSPVRLDSCYSSLAGEY